MSANAPDPPDPRDDFAAFSLGRFRILPPAAGPREGRYDLVMHRGAFGSGEHETTVSCVEVLETLPALDGIEVLDLGSGTGILALAALALGAAEATCVDVSESAVEVARANGRLNGFDGRLRHIVGSIDDVGGADFDLVVANLYGDLLLSLAEPIVARVRAGGRLLLSGMLWEWDFEVRRTFERLGCRLLEHRMLAEFGTALMRRG